MLGQLTEEEMQEWETERRAEVNAKNHYTKWHARCDRLIDEVRRLRCLVEAAEEEKHE